MSPFFPSFFSSSKEIAAALKEQHGIELDKKKIQLSESLKNFGNYEVAVKLCPHNRCWQSPR